MEKVFVTGADGMLGNSICRELIKLNYEVKAFCLNEKSSRTLNELPLEKAYGNVLDLQSLVKEMEGCSFVIHIAALTNVWPRRCSRVKQVNIEGAKNVMAVAKEKKIKRMIHIGSASSFDHGDLQNPGTENNGYNGWKYGMDYIDSKYIAQKLLLAEFKKNGFPVVIINPTFMIGPFDSGPSSGKMLIGFYKGCIPGYSGGGKNFVCSQDVAVAVVNALTLGRPGECYIAGNQNLSFKDFLLTAAGVIEKKFTLKRIPFALILLVGIFNSLVARIKGKAPKLSFGMAKLSGVNQYFSAEKARKELNMPQTPIGVGIKQCMDWFSKNGYLA